MCLPHPGVRDVAAIGVGALRIRQHAAQLPAMPDPVAKRPSVAAEGRRLAADATRGPSDLRDRKRLRTQAHLYDCAVALIIEHGYDNVSVDQICQRADVGRATFFRYFGSKAGLMIEFDRRVVEDIQKRLGQPGLDLEEQLGAVQTAMMNAWSGAHRNMRALGLDYLSSTAVSEMATVAAGIIQMTREIFAAGLERGEIETTLSPSLLATLFVTSMSMSIYHFMESRKRSTEAAAVRRAVLKLFLHGVSARE
jgi:AcrR family transcriptional regulator